MKLTKEHIGVWCKVKDFDLYQIDAIPLQYPFRIVGYKNEKEKQYGFIASEYMRGIWMVPVSKIILEK